MSVGWFDGGAGASGDMLLGALAGVGVPVALMQQAIDPLSLGIGLRVEDVHRAGLAATKIHVDVPEQRTVRHLPEILSLFESLSDEVALLAGEVFRRLAEAEAAVHRMPIEDVHFHEVGALDSIADIVCASAAMLHLAVDRVVCSTLSLGSGMTRGAHGPIPIPVPAVLELMRGVSAVQAGPAAYESTTPTGAALLVTLVDDWGPMPAMTVDRVGIGAGAKDSPDVANALRFIIGDSAASQ